MNVHTQTSYVVCISIVYCIVVRNEDVTSSTGSSSKGGVESEEEVRKKPPISAKPDSVVSNNVHACY